MTNRQEIDNSILCRVQTTIWAPKRKPELDPCFTSSRKSYLIRYRLYRPLTRRITTTTTTVCLQKRLVATSCDGDGDGDDIIVINCCSPSTFRESILKNDASRKADSVTVHIEGERCIAESSGWTRSPVIDCQTLPPGRRQVTCEFELAQILERAALQGSGKMILACSLARTG